jgi:uncharacterized protein (DUF433 family)
MPSSRRSRWFGDRPAIRIGNNDNGGRNTVSARITVTPGVCGGKPCIAGHRVRVSDIVIWHEHQGMTADVIVSEIPGLSLADIHAALAYCYENLDTIREEIRAELATADRYQSNSQSILQARLSQAKRVS